MRPAAIISGGQTGADQGALLAGEALGIRTGGHAPKGWRTDEGPAPWLGSRFGLIEHESPAYPPRTAANVFNSTGTVIFGQAHSPGCALTQRYCNVYRKPYFIVHWPNPDAESRAEILRVFREWLATHQIEVLNCAGNRERSNPGIREAFGRLLMEALQ